MHHGGILFKGASPPPDSRLTSRLPSRPRPGFGVRFGMRLTGPGGRPRPLPQGIGLMAVRKRRKAGQRPVVPAAEHSNPPPVPPTPQTAAKLRQDVIERLLREGRLRDEQVRAAREIRRVWEAVGRALFPSASRPDAPRQPHMRQRFRDPVARMTDVEEIVWRQRYRPWADEMAVPIAAGSVRISRLQIVLDIAVDNHGLRQVEAWYRMRHGLAFQHLQAALHRYAELAQWVPPDGRPFDSRRD